MSIYDVSDCITSNFQVNIVDFTDASKFAFGAVWMNSMRMELSDMLPLQGKKSYQNLKNMSL